MGSRSRGLYRKLGSAADLLPTLTNACACAGTYLHVHVRVRVRVRARALGLYARISSGEGV